MTGSSLVSSEKPLGFQVRGRALAILRENLGWSMNALAKEVGVNQSHLSRVESGQRDLSKAVAQRIAGVLRVPVEVFWKPKESAVA